MNDWKNQSAGYLVNHLARLLTPALAARIAPLGLSPGQFPILLELWAHDGQTQRELTHKLDLEQATMANTLARMERDGLIERKANPADARSQIVRLTRKSKLARQAAMSAAEEVNAFALSQLSPVEKQEIIRLLRMMIAALKMD